jgi:hypothetical protein
LLLRKSSNEASRNRWFSSKPCLNDWSVSQRTTKWRFHAKLDHLSSFVMFCRSSNWMPKKHGYFRKMPLIIKTGGATLAHGCLHGHPWCVLWVSDQRGNIFLVQFCDRIPAN